MQLETGKRDLLGILGDDQATQLRSTAVPSLNAETVHVLVAPVEEQLEKVMSWATLVSRAIKRRRQTIQRTPAQSTIQN